MAVREKKKSISQGGGYRFQRIGATSFGLLLARWLKKITLSKGAIVGTRSHCVSHFKDSSIFYGFEFLKHVISR